MKKRCGREDTKVGLLVCIDDGNNQASFGDEFGEAGVAVHISLMTKLWAEYLTTPFTTTFYSGHAFPLPPCKACESLCDPEPQVRVYISIFKFVQSLSLSCVYMRNIIISQTY